MRDVLFETAASADLGPIKEEKYLLPGTIAAGAMVKMEQ